MAGDVAQREGTAMDRLSHDFDVVVDRHLSADPSPAARVRRQVEWILRDPAGVRGVEHIAERAAMSPRSLRRLFRRETGTTPARFVERARIEVARRLLERPGTRVGWVAQRAGFASEERMRRAFRRAFDMSPRDYASAGSGTMRM